MKLNRKISARERWILAVAPAAIILAVYLFGFVDGLSAELAKAEKRADAAMAPAPPSLGPSSLEKVKMTRDAAKRDLKERQDQIAQLEAKIASLPKTGADYRPSASVIEQVESVFSHNGLMPITSESADDGETALNVPTAILDVLAPKINPNEPAGGHRQGRVWHYIFDSKTPRFQSAVKELVEKVPSVVPLSMNLVYNPGNLGETRLLELWLLY